MALPEDPNAIVRAFAANPAFRSAEAHELVNDANPFRRPVRPPDLDFLDYDREMPSSEAGLLTALLGHRMLRNAYDTSNAYLPPPGDSPARADRAGFYGDRARVLAAGVRTVLERHLFSFLAAERPEPPATSEALRDRVQGVFAERTAAPGRLYTVAGGLQSPREGAVFVLLQLSAFLPVQHRAAARALAGDVHAAAPGLHEVFAEDLADGRGREAAYRALYTDTGLTPAPGAYWQFLLGSSLARGNHLDRLARTPERFFEFLGAWTHAACDAGATAAPMAELLAGALDTDAAYFRASGVRTAGDVDALLADVADPLARAYGTEFTAAFSAGFEDARRLAALWDEDLATQVDWADRLDEYKAKAEKLQYRLDTEGIDVDLETFEETEEETSTTHVHDDHRLVVVEKGRMHFWNNVGRMIPMDEGDKLLIPAERLHGSMVLSGACTYHQPVIPDEMLRQV
ncbi:cupin domain-containing protein [Nocardiopsis baichengensis]|uniref:hypothetical protein n=1 Tax=Nocardiopsis baichengensis TaxID=280240 RepID=UPI000349C2B7|nr:hypothetical protein [Nocardiopsis baichengensis]